MTFNRRDVLQGSGAAALASILPLPGLATSGADTAAEAMLAETAETIFADYPEAAAGLGLDKGKRAPLKRRLSDRSAAGKAAAAARTREVLAKLNAIDAAALSPATRTNVEVVQTAYQQAEKGYALPYGDVATLTSGWRNSPYVVAQNVGAYLDIPQLLDLNHQIETPDDADAYLARMIAYADQLNGEAEQIRAAGAIGVCLPDFALAQALKQLEIARSGAVAQWDIVTSLAKRTAKMPGDYAGKAAKIATDRIAPALSAQIAALEAQKAQTGSTAGVWRLPQGDAYYAWALGAATTTTMTPDQVHAQGRDELARLHAKMDVILKAEGYTTGSVGARMTALGKDPRYLFPEGDPGRAEIMAYLRDKLREIRAQMPRAFETLVPGFVEVTRMSPAAEPGAPGAYGGAGSIDGKEPGRFWINLGNTSRWTRYSLPDLAYHEAIPGHAWQGEYTFKQPLIRTLMSFSAYSEGWGLYAEQIADELGVYDDFPAGRLGYLQSLAFRACRLVVDTGIHAKGWTRDQAIAFMMDNSGMTRTEVVAEVDRYIAIPGQALAYKIGALKIQELRQRAQSRLGERFDIRAFHDQVLNTGGLPLTVLESKIDRWIAAQMAS